MRYNNSMNQNKAMTKVTLENGKQTAILFYDMAPGYAMEQALQDRPGFWIKDVQVITEYTQMNGEESFYDQFVPDNHERRTSFTEEARPYGLPWAAL